MKARQGFTLLELLMVVIIIGILASIALPQYIKAAERARTSEALQLGGAIRSAQNRYKAQSPNNTYTTQLDELDAEMPATTRFWTLPASPIGAASVTFARSGTGTYAGETIGIAYDTGLICGTFTPYFGATAVTCP